MHSYKLEKWSYDSYTYFKNTVVSAALYQKNFKTTK